MFKRVTIVALVVAAFLVLAVPALAFNGYRGGLHRDRGVCELPRRPALGHRVSPITTPTGTKHEARRGGCRTTRP